MTRISLLETAHNLILNQLLSGGFAIDATIGNGHDTVFLAQCVGESGHVFGFDIQLQALSNTLLRLQTQELETRATLFHASHDTMLNHLPHNMMGQVGAIMFNLGYLPGAGKSVITQTATTLAGLDTACFLLAEQGIMTVLAYPGHEGGDQETRELTDWCKRLNQQQFQCEVIFSEHHQIKAPQLFVIRKSTLLL